MKNTILFFILIFAMSSHAASSKKPVVKNKPGSSLSTDVKFEGQLVGGKIQAPFESLTVVENEKGIDELIGVRKNFHDRQQKAKGLR